MARTTVEAQLAKLRKAKADLEKKEKALLNRTQGKVIAKIVQLATDNDISLALIEKALKADKPGRKKTASTKAAGATGTRAKVPPKYRNPANPEQMWTGRGRSPLWVQELQKNNALESALIK